MSTRGVMLNTPETRFGSPLRNGFANLPFASSIGNDVIQAEGLRGTSLPATSCLAKHYSRRLTRLREDLQFDAVGLRINAASAMGGEFSRQDWRPYELPPSSYWTIDQSAACEWSDAVAEKLFDPFGANEEGFELFVGVPLRVGSEPMVGTLVVLGFQPRLLEDDVIRTLRNCAILLAKLVARNR